MSTNLRPRLYWLIVLLGLLFVGLGTYQVMAQDSVAGEVELTGILEQVGDGFTVVSGQTISIVNGQAMAREVENALDDGDLPANCIPTRPAGWVTYVIQANDTLSGIAARTGSRVQELVRVNCITNRRLIATGAEIFVPLPIDEGNPTERCRLAGIEPERCRVLLFGDDDSIAERCRLADIEPERCRALFGEDNTVAERCRLAGLEPERCRALVFVNDDDLGERCRLNQIEPERCRALLFGTGDDDDNSNSGSGDNNSGHSGDDENLGDENNENGNGDHSNDDGDNNDRDDAETGNRSGSNSGEG